MTVNLTWNESISTASQIERYEVWRAQATVAVQPPIDEFTKIFEIEVERDAFTVITNSEDLYSYEDLTADTDSFFYYYFVKAIPVSGPASRSAVQEVAQSTSLFGSFTMDADFVDPSIVVSWSKPISPTITNYLVQRSIDAGAFVTIATRANNVFSYTDTDLSLLPGSTFTYRVRATRPGGTRDSNTDDVFVVPPTAPVLSNGGGTVDIKLDWTASVSTIGIDSYRVERSTNGGAYAVVTTVSGATLTFTDTGRNRLVNEYDYRVYAIDNITQETVSNTLNLPIVTATRVVFNADDTWEVPVGVTAIDILCVGAGGAAFRLQDTLDFGAEMMAPGGGGGGVVVTNGVTVTPGDTLTITVGVGTTNQGEESKVVAPGPTTLAQAGGGGFGAVGTSGNVQASPGSATNGSGAGGNNDFVFGPLDFPPSAGSGTGKAGGTCAVGANINNHATGGGGGAGAVGGNGVAGVGVGVNGTPGVGGVGIVPAASAIGGAWGADIGEGGFFGGGGGGGTEGDGPVFGTVNWVRAANGTGGSAANTGGGARVAASPTFATAEPGFSGIVVIYYLG